MADISREKKIENLVKKYNISNDYAQYIINTDEELLNITDLKLKYDNPNFGKLPDWLSEEELSLMIWKSIQQTKCKNTYLFESITEDDLYQDIQLRIRKKSNKIKNYQYLKAMISKWILTIIVNTNRNKCYIPVSLNDTYMDNKDNSFEYTDILYNHDDIDDSNICQSIESIPDQSIQQFLIIVGYLVCNILELRNKYYTIYENSSNDIKENLTLLETEIINNDFSLSTVNRFQRQRKNNTLIKNYIKKIIIILNLNIFQNRSKKTTMSKNFSINKVLDEIRYYLIQNKIFLK